MARKTNKTAHVLNLIAGGGNEDGSEITDESLHESINENSGKGGENDSSEYNIESIIEKNNNIIESQNIDSFKSPGESNISETAKNYEPPKYSAGNSAPVVEILFNEHDPLSDLLKDVLEGIEDVKDTQEDNTAESCESALSDDKDQPSDIIENIHYDEIADELQEDNSADSEVAEDTMNNIFEADDDAETDHNPEADNTPRIQDSISNAENGNINSASSKKGAAHDTLLNELEKSNRLHFHDRRDLNSMLDLDFKYVNVYEKIIQDKILDYMKKFDMCMCDRCIIDTFALALTFLPTKIVVVDRDSIFPMISFYETKNTAIISTALIKACMMVIDKPHH